mmetsp:Transcript_18503/g.37371  ORF Transcript_18503/g.37371 Transcript_18503/m.37371 type:complete len:81 (-) Transcript_18503:1860-2102(-)
MSSDAGMDTEDDDTPLPTLHPPVALLISSHVQVQRNVEDGARSGSLESAALSTMDVPATTSLVDPPEMMALGADTVVETV